MRKKYFKFIFIGLLLQFSNSLFAGTDEAAAFTSSDLPIIIIKTNGQQIIDAEKIIVNMGIINNGPGKRNYITDPYNDYNGKIGIEYRGSTSQETPKKPYGFETVGDDSSAIDTSLLGLPKENDWVLLPPYSDKTLVRDVLVYTLSNNIGRYATRSVYCELVLNGEYQGVYVLLEKIKRNKNRVNIKKLESTDTAAVDITGGYIIKLDKTTGDDNGGWNSKYPINPRNQGKLYIQYHYPKPSDINDQQKKYIQEYFEEFEKALSGAAYNDTANGYAKFIDVDSFIDHMLLTELCKNVDGYRLSTYLYKDADSRGGKLNMGPAWDYKLAFGNCNYDKGGYTYGWQIDWPNDPYHNQIPFWWQRLLMDKNFSGKVYKRWTELRSNEFSYTMMCDIIDSLVTLVGEAKDRNFDKWDLLGNWVWPNYFVGDTYEEEVEYLKDWIEKRLTWLDANMFGKPTVSVDSPGEIMPALYSLSQNYPNPFNPETVISYQIGKSSEVKLKVYNYLGEEIQTLVNQYQSPGIYKINFNPLNMSSGNYIYVLETGEVRFSKMMTFIK